MRRQFTESLREKSDEVLRYCFYVFFRLFLRLALRGSRILPGFPLYIERRLHIQQAPGLRQESPKRCELVANELGEERLQ